MIVATVASIRWLDSKGHILGKLNAAQATAIVKAGVYVGKCEPRRVHYIQEQDTRPVVTRTCFTPDPYRDGYYIGEGEPMIHAVPITSKTVDLWDKHFYREHRQQADDQA